MAPEEWKNTRCGDESMKKTNGKAFLMMMLAMIIFGSIGVFRRYIPLSSAALACFRGLSGALLLYVLGKLRGRRFRWKLGRKNLLWLVFTGALMGLDWILLFEAYNYTTVATATLCYYMQPTIIILLSPLVFHEKITGKKGMCAVISFVGMVLVSGIVENGIPRMEEAAGVLLGLGAAVFYAAVVILTKKLSGIDPYERVIVQLLFAAVVLLPYLLAEQAPMQGEWTAAVVVMLLIVGFVHTGLAYALYSRAMDGLEAQTIAILGYLDPIVALLLSMTVLQEPMSYSGLLGAAMIIGAALFGELGAKKETLPSGAGEG